MPPMPRARGGSSAGGGGSSAGGTLAMRGGSGAAAASSSAAAAGAKRGAAQQPPQQPGQDANIYNANNLKNNAQVVYFLRIYMTMVAGAVVGILGATGWRGLVCYLISQAAVVPLLVAKGRGSVREYFPSWGSVAVDHVFSSTAVLSYVLFWMIGYNLGHVF